SYCFTSYLYCYVHHPDLHSFPTRRSSDLRLDLGQVQDVVDQVEQVVPGRVDRLGEVELLVRQVALRVLAQLVGQDEQAVQEPGGDRKSTRLNSSHVSISYAVFCLKKKNKS